MNHLDDEHLTRHAATRSSQRGVTGTVCALVLLHGDIELPQHRGCRSLQISERAAACLIADGTDILDVERARRTTLIVDELDRIVTVMRTDPRRRFQAVHNARRLSAYR
jgi:hypothetical protein